MGLTDKIQDKTVRANIVADCTKLMDEQVAAKNGLSGVALKAAYGAVKKVEPGYITSALNRLLPSVVTALEPIWFEGLQAGDPVDHLTQNRSTAADALLSVTDARIEKASGLVRSSYNKLRKSVKGDVEDAVPGLAKIIHTHIGA